jgi:hypothetical protein
MSLRENVNVKEAAGSDSSNIRARLQFTQRHEGPSRTNFRFDPALAAEGRLFGCEHRH